MSESSNSGVVSSAVLEVTLKWTIFNKLLFLRRPDLFPRQ
jgi:hypothetical protein